MSPDVPDVREAPQLAAGRRSGFRAPHGRCPFITCAASARKRTLREIILSGAVRCPVASEHATRGLFQQPTIEREWFAGHHANSSCIAMSRVQQDVGLNGDHSRRHTQQGGPTFA